MNSNKAKSIGKVLSVSMWFTRGKMEKISGKSIFKVFKYIILIGLTFISLFLSWEAFLKYKSKDTNLKKSQEQVKKQPTVTLCLKPHDEFVYGQDYHINIYNSPEEFGNDVEHNLNILQEGSNSKHNVEMVKIVSAFSGNCYKISPIESKIDLSDIMVLSVKFNEIVRDFAKQSIEIFVTSDSNAFGIFRAYWYEGELFKTEVYPKGLKLFGFSEYQFNYIEGTNGCSVNQSWYNCYADMAEELTFEDCPSKCLAHSVRLGIQKIKYCQPQTLEWDCSNRLLRNLQKHIIANKSCPRPCKIIEYEGTEMETISEYNHPNTIAFGYYHIPPYVTYVFDEYLIFDFLGLVSTVGGSLGLFIGFSIIAVISKCFSCLLSFYERYNLRVDVENQ